MPYKDKEVHNAKTRERYRRDKEQNPEKLRTRWAQANASEAKRLWQVERLYGLSAAIYMKMIEDQDNKCLICKQPETWKGRGGNVRPLCVDHCHRTGKVRGLLCTRCNAVLGYVDDDENILSDAIKYLQTSMEN